MELDKELHKLSQRSYNVIFKNLESTVHLENKIYNRITGVKKTRNPIIPSLVPITLLLILGLLLPWSFIQKSNTNGQESAYEPNRITINKEYSFTEDEQSPLQVLTIREVIVDPPYINVTLHATVKEKYNSYSFINAYLTDNKGRKYWNMRGDGNNGEDTYQFISEKKLEAIPEKIYFHFDGVRAGVKDSVGNFSVSLSDDYPREVHFDDQQIKIEKAYYESNRINLNITQVDLLLPTIYYLRIKDVGPTNSSAKLDRDKNLVMYSIEAPEKEHYQFEIFRRVITLPNKSEVEVDLLMTK